MNEYNLNIKQCQEELTWYASNNKNLTLDNMLDNPIYPTNEELREDFTNEAGFDQMEFLLFLIRTSDFLEQEYCAEIDDFIIVAKK